MTGNTVSDDPSAERYLNPHQARLWPPTDFEDALGDAIEAAYSSGKWELDDLLAELDSTGPVAPSGQPWTVDEFTRLMASLAEGEAAS